MIPSIFPPSVRTVAVVAPAGGVNPDTFNAGVALLRQSGVRVKIGTHLCSPAEAPYFAAAQPARAADFNAAIRDEQVDLILAARGGFGSAQILDDLDFDTLRTRNLPVVGYSDITALHCAMLARDAGIPIAAPSASKLAEAWITDAAAEHTRASWRLAFATADQLPQPLPLFTPLVPVSRCESVMAGRPFAANLTVLASLCGSRYVPDLRGRILILEDVNEPLYRIDRALTQLGLCGLFDSLAGVVFGRFTHGDGEVAGGELFRRYARKVAAPVYADFQFGHVLPMTAVNARQFWRVVDGVVSVSAA